MRKKKVIEALRMLQDEVPEYFEDVIMADCPCDLGLPAKYRARCGMADTSTEFMFDYCRKCWMNAMGKSEGKT